MSARGGLHVSVLDLIVVVRIDHSLRSFSSCLLLRLGVIIFRSEVVLRLNEDELVEDQSNQGSHEWHDGVYVDVLEVEGQELLAE